MKLCSPPLYRSLPFHLLPALVLSLALWPGVVTAAKWIEQDAGFSTGGLVVFSMDAVDANVVWALAGDLATFSPNQEFTRTTDGGSTWSAGTVPGADGLLASAISALDASTAWAAFTDIGAATRPKIFKTTDGGTTWVHQATAYPNAGSFLDVVHFFDANDGVAIGDPVGGYFEIYTTSDGGDNWVRVPEANIPPPLSSEFGLIPGPSSDARGNTIWFGTFAPAGGRVYRSTDRGTTWTVGTPGLGANTFVGDVAFRNASNGLLTASDFGDPNPVITVASTTDGGDTWTAMDPPAMPFPFALAWAPGTAATYFVTNANTFDGGLGSAYTVDDGVEWTLIDQVSHLAVDFVSSDVGWTGGLTRDASNPPAPRSAGRNPTVGHPASFKLSALSRDSRAGLHKRVPRAEASPSASRGGTVGGMWKWSPTVAVELTSFTATANDGAVHLDWRTSHEANHAGFRVLRADDESDAFAVVSGNELIDDDDADHIYRLDDPAVDVGATYHYLLVGIDNRGGEELFGPLRVTVTVALPTALKLHASHPNPFNPSTTIAFDLPKAGRAAVAIYDPLGHRVRNLAAGTYPAGTHVLTWDGRNDRGVGMASGVYFVRLETAAHSMSQKIVLAR